MILKAVLADEHVEADGEEWAKDNDLGGGGDALNEILKK